MLTIMFIVVLTLEMYAKCLWVDHWVVPVRVLSRTSAAIKIVDRIMFE